MVHWGPSPKTREGHTVTDQPTPTAHSPGLPGGGTGAQKRKTTSPVHREHLMDNAHTDGEDEVGVSEERESPDSGEQRRLPGKLTFAAHEPALKDVGGRVQTWEGRSGPPVRSLPAFYHIWTSRGTGQTISTFPSPGMSPRPGHPAAMVGQLQSRSSSRPCQPITRPVSLSNAPGFGEEW